MNDFYAKMADILEVEKVAEDDVLANFQAWDSLSVLSVIAMLDAQHGVNLSALDLKDVRTLADVWNLVQAKKKA